MLQSRPITRNGQLLGAAVLDATSWLFIAVDPRMEDIDRVRFRDCAEAERAAHTVYARNTSYALPAGHDYPTKQL